MDICIRVDASKKLGLGHLSRMISLADNLIERKFKIFLLMIEGNELIEILSENNYDCVVNNDIKNETQEEEWILSTIKKYKPKICIFDIKTDLTAKCLSKLRKIKIKTVVIDDSSDRRLFASQVFYPPVPQVLKLKWNPIKPEIYSDWNSVIIRDQFFKIKTKVYPMIKNQEFKPTVLISLGGNTNFNFLSKILISLSSIKISLKIILTLPQKDSDYIKIKEWNNLSHHDFHILVANKNIASLMAESHLAIASFGVTAYELLAVGTPSILYSLTEDHMESASLFSEAGVSICLGKIANFDCSKLEKTLTNLFNNPSKLEKMSQPYISSQIRNSTKNVVSRITRDIKKFDD